MSCEMHVQKIEVDSEVKPSKVQQAEVKIETTDHSRLINRDLPEQHPISSITGLEDALQRIAAVDDTLSIAGAAADAKAVQRALAAKAGWEDLPFRNIDGNTLVSENGTLKVNVVDEAEEDNTLPISSSGVMTIVGNIGVLLTTI